jgi:hypothetical protein
MPFYIASSEKVDERPPDSGRRTIQTGCTRERFRRYTAVGVIENTVDGRFGQRGENLLGGERPRRTARHS